ncbi:MAG: ribosome maturation factor RimM [Acidobacteriaceae bacterium]
MLLARLLRPQGRHGELLAEILTDFPERFADRQHVLLLPVTAADKPRPMELQRHWLHKGGVVLKFKGVESINDAEPLRGMHVAVPAAERIALDDAFYIGDLMDCRLLDEQNGKAVEVGRIVDVQRELVSPDLLVVESGDAEEVLVPFAKAYLVSVDLSAKEVVMRLPEGLLTLNVPSKTAPAEADSEPGSDSTADEEG